MAEGTAFLNEPLVGDEVPADADFGTLQNSNCSGIVHLAEVESGEAFSTDDLGPVEEMDGALVW